MYLKRTVLDNLVERLYSFNLISTLLMFLVFSFMITVLSDSMRKLTNEDNDPNKKRP